MARETGGLGLEIKPSGGVIQTRGMSSAPGIPKQPLHLWWHNPYGSRSITFPAGAGSCFHPSPCRKKSLIQAIENICKSNYLPRAFPGAVPPAPLPPLPASRLSPARLFPGAHTKGLAAALPTPTALPRRCQPQLPLSAKVPISSLGVGAEGPVVASRLYTPNPSPPAPGECCLSLSWDLGSLPCSFSSLTPCGERHRGHRDTPSRLFSH